MSVMTLKNNLVLPPILKSEINHNLLAVLTEKEFYIYHLPSLSKKTTIIDKFTNFCIIDKETILFIQQINSTNFFIFKNYITDTEKRIPLQYFDQNFIFLKNTKEYIIVGDSNNILLYSLKTQQFFRHIYHNEQIVNIEISPNNNFIGFHDKKNCFIFSIPKKKMIKVENGNRVLKKNEKQRDEIKSIKFTPDSTELIIYGNGSEIEFFDINIGYISETNINFCPLSNSTLFLNSTFFLCKNNDTVYIFNSHTRKKVYQTVIPDSEDAYFIGCFGNDVFLATISEIFFFSIKKIKNALLTCDLPTETLTNLANNSMFESETLSEIFNYL